MEYTLYQSYWDGDKSRVIPDVEWVDSIELDNESYQFYILLIAKREDGYYLSTDSGCSCPSPWENHEFPGDFTGPLTADQAREEAASLIDVAKEREYTEGPDEYEAMNLLARII